MKIAYISTSTIPSRTANSIHVMKMCQAFAKNGHDVSLFVPNNLAEEELADSHYDFYGVDECFNIRKIKMLPCIGKTIMFNLVAALRARKHKVDLVYGRSLFGCIFSSLLGLTTVFESHVPISHLRFGKLKFSRNMLKRFEKIVVISETLKQYYMEEHGISGQRIKVAHDGADEPKESETISFQNSGKLQVGYIGHLYPGRALEIIEPLAKGCPWAYFHLIGGSESDIDYWQKQLGELDNVKFYGFMPPSHTEKYRRSFDVLVAPYQKRVTVLGKGNTASWMSPLKIFEYMSEAKPMLVSDLPALREVLQHNVTALLCHPEDVASWANALERLRDDSDLAARIGKAAYEEFKAKYTWKTRAKQVLENVVSGSSS